MSFRLSPRNFCMADAMPFQQHHEARIFGRNLNDVLTDDLFLDLRSNIQVGDEVVVCGYQDHTVKRMTQFARLRVFAVDKAGVKFVLDGAVTDIPITEDEPKPEKAPAKIEVVRGFNCFNAVDKSKDDVIETFRTKKEAEVWADAYNTAN